MENYLARRGGDCLASLVFLLHVHDKTPAQSLVKVFSFFLIAFSYLVATANLGRLGIVLSVNIRIR